MLAALAATPTVDTPKALGLAYKRPSTAATAPAAADKCANLCQTLKQGRKPKVRGAMPDKTPCWRGKATWHQAQRRRHDRGKSLCKRPNQQLLGLVHDDA